MDEYRAIHDRIYRLTQTGSKRYYGMISICPHMKPEHLEEETLRCTRQLGFKGIKIATIAHGVNPSSVSGMGIFSIASNLGIPVMIHTGGGDFGHPDLLEKPIKAFPDIPIVIAHGGGEGGVGTTIRLAKQNDNVFIEPSWRNVLDLNKMKKEVGSSKIMYSSDMPQNIPTQLNAFKTVFTTDKEQEDAFYKTAKEVFKL